MIAEVAKEVPTLAPRTARLAALLEEAERRTVVLDELWDMWAKSDPGGIGRPERRANLADAIEELRAANLVTPSKSIDKSALPYLPTRVTLPAPANSPTATALARSIIWRPELAWALSARLTVGQVQTLSTINIWLRDNSHKDDELPLRERSLEVFGHEKVLDKAINTTLFGPGRITLDMLRTFRTHPPLAGTRVGDGPVLLVVENDNTFHSIRAALQGQVNESSWGTVGYVAWGAGGAFEASVRSTGDVQGITRVRYFGDIDIDGLRIPRSAAATAAREGLPPVLPAYALYQMLLDTDVRQQHRSHVIAPVAAEVAAWLDRPQLVSDVTALLGAAVRIPQEALTATTLVQQRTWLDGL
ncbi:hypothetical protein JWS13_04125 (plasmid) [Rhodococcus pseudokoreensis]|uniref:Wadjet protein JetD C-terminal domain-containing protein n=1 Tax=Rhodococcus pseudokoreensis TaxID=2811421 RepID=A0A974VYB9_9NOCA|nr:Wadjet anti-phage system protein JetD domain-containing protein [Rhodococcus pseudokoreensis]QSE87853.1 hypothetical protein JWS13_04125 [Rhodococcus pseudokoreensis]